MEFRVGVDDGIRTLPRRFRQMKEKNLTYNRGFPDLAYMPALLDARLEPYAYIWLVEYDVDWTGHWAHFFERTMGSTADLLGTTIFPRSQSENWYHWNWFSTPAEVESKCQTRSFLPIARFSRGLLDLYVRAMETGLWRGHTEALYPTIALHHGLLIEDLGSQGPYCPERWRKKNYVNTPMDWSLSPGTFVSAPVLHNAYFHEMPVAFGRPNFLYHPVKPGD